ncbi:glutathione S-transferase family protein [Candidatus Spongiihabitans sp.]|uniref:glutathione S-transferase family protein n=1 Tax=Candidatus Spongiihabitans sp. TaxID=3101308 RepID=UPI003C7D8E50
MIDLYTWSTPNGQKVSIMLEEIGMPYTVHPIDITNDEQFDDDFLKISPNNKIPAIVDHDNDMTMMESGAILLYLADKSGRFMPSDDAARWRTMQWLMFQMGGLGPMLGQAHHFLRFNKGVSDYAENRYAVEAQRLYDVIDQQLENHEYLADQYSIADIASWPWIARFEWQGIDLNEYPNVKRWYLAIAARPAVQRGYRVPDRQKAIPLP